MTDDTKTTEFPKAYDPKQWEETILKRWEEADLANPDTCIKKGVTKADAEPFSIFMAPPNVTGILHLGHAMENSLMDTMARYKRMRGFRTLFLPGADHAAVATQARVEKNLIEKEGLTNPRQELGREKLLEKIRAFADNSKSTIIKQVRSLGSSCDWSRFVYTFDEKRALAVNTVFKKMYDDGLIYRGYRVVNWSTKGQSTASDDELVYIERSTTLYTFRYSKEFPIAIASTRPETKLGDTAVAVHPNDERYQSLIGKVFTVDVGAQAPLEIKIIADENVDPEFGTGAVGVTPAHSQIDFEMYERHGNIKLIQVIGTDGKMTKAAGSEYAGLPIEAARKKFVTWLQSKELIEKEELIIHKVGTSDRFGDVVEVLPMTQWFIAVNKPIPNRGKSLKVLMREATTTGLNCDATQKVTIQPERFSKIYLHWIDKLRDWCISRQIWWGHRIPVWYKGDEVYCDIQAPEGDGWEQDPDTLDTWFSSGLWSFSTLGWPKDTADLRTYHPNSWMQMGYEILFFWMARMILMTTYTLETIPFKKVYIHGMLRDKEGRKFSKSLGNGIEPLEVTATYGTDALRYALLADITPGNDSRFSFEKVENGRNLVNKLWNMGRYVSNLPPTTENQQSKTTSQADDWIVAKLNKTIGEVTRHLESYNFSLAAETLREFSWNEFADWYVEIHKIEKNDAVLRSVFETLLKLWHPFTPFVTEAIGKEIGIGDLLMGSAWPQGEVMTADLKVKGSFDAIIELIQKIRNVRAMYHIDPKEKLTLTIVSNETDLTSFVPIIKQLGRIDDVLLTQETAQPQTTASIVTGSLHAFVHLGNVIDITKEKLRLTQEKTKLETAITSFEQRLADPAFRSKAPADIIALQEKTLAENQSKLTAITESITALG